MGCTTRLKKTAAKRYYRLMKRMERERKPGHWACITNLKLHELFKLSQLGLAIDWLIRDGWVYDWHDSTWCEFKAIDELPEGLREIRDTQRDMKRTWLQGLERILERDAGIKFDFKSLKVKERLI